MAIVRPMLRAESSAVNVEAVQELLKDLEFALGKLQIETAKATLRAILTQIPGIKSKNAAFLNAITSIQEGVASDDISMREQQRMLKDEFKGYELHLNNMLEEVRTPSQKEEMLSISDLLEHSKHALTSFEQNRDSLERAIAERGIVTAYAPVLALTTPMLEVSKCKANAFNATSFEGYPILHKQMVAGISTEKILDMVNEGKGSSVPGKPKKSSGRLPGSTHEQRQEVLDQFVDSVISKYPKLKLISVGAPYHWYETTWFWMLPQAHFNLLKRCTLSPTTVQSLSIKKWSFPFASR